MRVGDGATVAAARAWRTPFLLKVSTEGRHFAMNALAVIAAVRALGADRTLALCALAAWSPPAGRGARETIVIDAVRDGETIDLIDDAFNANPASLAAALEVLSRAHPHNGVGRISRGRRVAILGDMLELGPEERALHAAVAQVPAMATLDLVHCVGPRMRVLYDALPDDKRGRWAETAQEMLGHVTRLVDSGDVVLVKGSKGIKVSLIVDAIRKLGQRNPTRDPEA